MAETYLTIECLYADDLKHVRRMLGFTQKNFAEFIGCSKPTVERWESSDKPITGPVVRLVQMLEQNPDYVAKISIPEKVLPTRMWYMYENKACTLIDTDEALKKVIIKNYTDNNQFRAFGVNERPTFSDYTEFLESRCFPKTRDNLKLVLRDLDLPFYDPFLIIKKNQGRMAEDNFWLRIEE